MLELSEITRNLRAKELDALRKMSPQDQVRVHLLVNTLLSKAWWIALVIGFVLAAFGVLMSSIILVSTGIVFAFTGISVRWPRSQTILTIILIAGMIVFFAGR